MIDDPFAAPIVQPIKPLPIAIKSDVTYKTADDVQLKMDIYAQSGLAGGDQLPAIFFVHGGPIAADMKPKDWGIFRSYGRLAAAEGFIGATFNHRFFSREDGPRSVRDINDAIRFIRDNGARFNVDPDRICLWVFSGGGTLLGSIAASNRSYLLGWLAFYAPLHTAAPTPATAADSEEGLLAAGRILESDETGEIPMFIARAGRDRPVLNETIDNFVRKALELNRPLTLVNHPAGRHGFDFLDDDQRSREVIQMAIAFLKNAAQMQ